MKTPHTFKIIDDTDYRSDRIYPEVEMRISSEAGLGEIVEAFQHFLQAIGYVLPPDSYLDFVEEIPSKMEFDG